MTNTVGFPGLFEHVFTFDRVAFELSIGSFSLSIRWYGLIIGLGFILALAYVMSRAKEFSLRQEDLLDAVIYCIPVCIVAARAYYVLSSWDYYGQHLNEIFRIWEGGLAIYGAVIAAFVVVWLLCRRRKLDARDMLDLGALGLMIGQLVGRWGNFVNAEAYGGPTALPWGMSINGSAPVHPTFFYESIWNLAGFALLSLYVKRREFKGEICLWYVAWYGLGRFMIEGMRTDSLYLGSTGIRISQLLAGVSVVVAGGILAYCYITKRYTPAHQADSE